jgi:hypothetical protein
MNIYVARMTISGINNAPEVRTDRIIAEDWASAFEVVKSAIETTGWIVQRVDMYHAKDDSPFKEIIK